MAMRRGSVGASTGRRGAMEAGAGPAALSAAQAASREMERLRERLLESLTSTVNDTVETVCEEFEESLAQATQPLFASGAASGRSGGKNKGDDAASADYDLYYSCCRRLVAYIVDNMVTSPDFAQQMDRIILACHSNASAHVLHSVVTKSLWFHRRDNSAADNDDDPEGEDDDDDDDDDLAPPVRAKPSRVSKVAPSTRGVKRRAPPPPPPANNSSKMKSPVKKRARKELAVQKSRHSRVQEESADEETEDDEPKRKPRRRAARVQSSDEEDEDQEEEEDDGAQSEHASQPHYAQADELLKFKDAIGDMCYPERRTPAQTRFFKDRLRKAIQFVDAQLCKPPKGETCGWGCAKIRRQMCNRDLPCRNKVCRLWHDVEAHTDRCQNTHCEFRIRVMLRETMYKIDHKKVELNGYRTELQSKKKKLHDLKHESLSDHETYVERRLLDNEISQLEADIEEADKELGVFKATKKTYWATLNEIGLTIEDDTNDQFPDFGSHYVAKKAPAKKKPALKSQNENSSTRSATPRPQRGRRGGANPHNDDGSLSSPVSNIRQSRERITRRSTQQSVQVMTNGVIELDDDDDDEEEEGKTDRSDTEIAARDRENQASEDLIENEPTLSTQDIAKHEVQQGDNDTAEAIEAVEVSARGEEKNEAEVVSSADDPQSADYVIDEPEHRENLQQEPSPGDTSTEADAPVGETPSTLIEQMAETTTEQSASTENTVLAAFNDVVDGATSSEPTAPESRPSESAIDTAVSGPLLPF